MKINNKGEIMNNFKKVGLTALAGSLAVVSANAAEMSVSGATMLTYTSEDGTEVTGNPLGMKTNLAFSASGDVNGYTVSYVQVSADQFAGMSTARLSVDMGDMGVIAFDQGSGSGLATIDDKMPTAAEEIWDGLDTTTSGRVGTAGSIGVLNYVNTFSGVTVNAAARKGSGTKLADGASSGVGGSAWDVALTTDGSMLGIDGLSIGAGYGTAEVELPTADANKGDEGETEDITAFVTYAMGPVTIGYQESAEDAGGNGGANQYAQRWGVAFNINENLSVSYGEAETEFAKAGAAHVTEDVEGFAVSYTMGSMKIAGNMNEGSNMAGTSGSNDEMTEIALSFAF
jgi:outer membrane protein OmpU